MRGIDMPHVLDLVLTDSDFIQDLCYLSPLGKSDHAVLQFTCCLNYSKHTDATKFNYNKGNYDELREYMCRD